MSSPEEVQTAGDSRDPSTFLSSLLQTSTTIKLNSGTSYKGELQSVDGYMNIALENAVEYPGGRKWGDVFIRGNNGRCCTGKRVHAAERMDADGKLVLYISQD